MAKKVSFSRLSVLAPFVVSCHQVRYFAPSSTDLIINAKLSIVNGFSWNFDVLILRTRINKVVLPK